MDNINESSVAERFTQLVEIFSNGNNSAFARAIGVSPQAVHDYTSGRKGDPSFKVLQKIARTYPQLRMKWLLAGEGYMLRSYEDLDASSREAMDAAFSDNPQSQRDVAAKWKDNDHKVFVLGHHESITQPSSKGILPTSMNGFIEVADEKDRPVLVSIGDISHIREATQPQNKGMLVIELRGGKSSVMTPLTLEEVKALIIDAQQ